MMSYTISIFFLLIIARFNNIISKKMLFPPFYLSMVWIVMISLHLFFTKFSDYTPYSLRTTTLLYFFSTIFFFSLGGALAKLNDRSMYKKNIHVHLSNKALNWLVVIIITLLLLFIFKIKEITGEYFNMLLFRYYTSVKSVDIGLIKYGFIFSLFATMLVLIKHYNSEAVTRFTKFKTITVILCSFALAYLSGSRGAIFFLSLSMLGIYSIYRRVNIKLIAKSVVIILILFFGMATALKKAMPNQHHSDVKYNAAQKLDYFLYSYGTLPLSAFDNFLNKPYDVLNGEILLRFPKALLFKIGVTSDPPQKLVEEYSEVPDLVNVYTGYYKLIKDFGILYSFFVMLILGYLHSYFFFNVKKSFDAIIGFSVLLFPLTMLFFEENFISILSTWIQLIFYTFMAKKIIKITYD